MKTLKNIVTATTIVVLMVILGIGIVGRYGMKLDEASKDGSNYKVSYVATWDENGENVHVYSNKEYTGPDAIDMMVEDTNSYIAEVQNSYAYVLDKLGF